MGAGGHMAQLGQENMDDGATTNLDGDSPLPDEDDFFN
jgi:hypothetical protein